MSDRLDLVQRIMAQFVPLWRAYDPLPDGVSEMPAVVAKGSGFRPPTPKPHVFVDVVGDRGDLSGTPGARTYNIPLLVQVSIHVPDGQGPNVAARLARAAADCVEAMQVEGLSTYGARLPYDLPSPPAGYFGVGVDTPGRYVGP